MKNNFYRRGLLAMSVFFLGACVLFGQKNSDKQDDPILLYPLGLRGITTQVKKRVWTRLRISGISAIVSRRISK